MTLARQRRAVQPWFRGEVDAQGGTMTQNPPQMIEPLVEGARSLPSRDDLPLAEGLRHVGRYTQEVGR